MALAQGMTIGFENVAGGRSAENVDWPVCLKMARA